jgi:hypothetical protein
MAKRENVIHLNGKRYDAYSGALLNDVSPRSMPASPTSRSIDGLAKSGATLISPPPKAHTPLVPAAKPISDFTRKPAAHLKHHATKKSQTLIRSTVSKPTDSLKHRLKSDTHTHALVAKPELHIEKKLSTGCFDSAATRYTTCLGSETSPCQHPRDPRRCRPSGCFDGRLRTRLAPSEQSPTATGALDQETTVTPS